MSGRVIKSGSTDQYCEVKVWTTADGVPNTTLAYNTSGLAIWYQIGNAVPVEVVVGGSPAPATMSAGGAHADWGIYHVAQGRYKIGLADAVVASAANVTVWIVFTDCDSAPCEIDVVGYDKTAAAVGANTVVPATPANVTTSTSTITALISGLTSQSTASPVERSPNDTNPITFSWPVSGATITAEVSINNAAYGATTGVVSFLRTEGSLHYYSLSFNAADRPTAEGTSRYKLVDGTYTQYVTLRVEGASTDAAGIRSAVGLSAANLDTQLGDILGDTNELQTNQGNWLTATSVTVSDKTGFSIAGIINTLDELDTAQDTQHGTTQSAVTAVAADVTTILGRVTTTVATLWANLTAMITGSGATAAYTIKALENAPAGGGGLTEENIQDIAEATAAEVLSVSENIPLSQDGVLTAYKSALWTQQLTGLVALTGYTDIAFVLKRRVEDPDSMALLKVTETEGLTVLYGVTSPDSSLASITVDQESPTGEITLNVLPGAMAQIPPGKYLDGAKMYKEDSDKVLRSGSTIIRNSPVD